jgi:hypothetical protein
MGSGVHVAGACTRVVSDVAGGGAEVDDGHGLGAHGAKGVDVGHDVVPHLLLLLLGHGKVDVIEMRTHLRQLLLRDGQTLTAHNQRERERT